MARKEFFEKTRLNIVRILIVLALICFSAFTFIACGPAPDISDSNDYTKAESDTGVISNASFEFGSASLTLDDFPQTSPLNWSLSVDNSARSSNVNSGIVDVSGDGWSALLGSLYDDDDFLDYAAKKFNIDVDDIKAENDNDEELVKEQVLEILETKFPSPESATDDSGNKVLMINNYNEIARHGLGTAQKATSSSSVVIEKGKIAKISVFVKTSNLVGSNDYGANFRVKTMIKSTLVNEFGITGIISDDDWNEYTLYVEGDKNFDTSITVMLGLGLGSTKGSDVITDYTEGTAFFDNLTYELLDEMPTGVTIENCSVDLNNPSNKNYFDATTYADKALLFNAEVLNTLTPNVDLSGASVGLTESSNGLTSETILGSANSSLQSTPATDSISLSLKNASATVIITDSKFAVAPESYAFVSFDVKTTNNSLYHLDKNGITVFIYDVNGTAKNINNVQTVSFDEETQRVGVLVKNNFPELDTDKKYPTTREFNLQIVVGPTDVASKSLASDFSSGDVVISNMSVLSGKTYDFVRENVTKDGDHITSYTISDDEVENAKVYDFISSVYSENVVSLYASNQADYTATTESFSLTPSNSDIGTITYKPAMVNGYTGVSANHVYVSTADDAITEINTNANAGLINTKYLTAYSQPNLADALGHTGEKDVQPLMIYNDTASSYGFIGSNVKVEASAYASITLKLRVYGDAKAFVYVVDLDSDGKSVLELNFKKNTDGYNYVSDGEDVSYKLAFENITKDDMDTAGANKGWATLTFYIASGATAKNLRLEIWNGSRDGQTASSGYVFADKVTVTTSSAFTEPTSWEVAFTSSSSILYSAYLDDATMLDDAVYYKRELDKTETAFNKEQTESNKKVSYDTTYVWAKNKDTIYAIYNTVDPVIVDPYAGSSEDTDTEEAGCTATSDPSTFWLQFSSILLVVALVVAIVMLIIKNVRSKKKRSKKVKKGGYDVSSRISAKKTTTKLEKSKKQAKENDFDEYEDENYGSEEEITPVEETPTQAEDDNKSEETPSLDEFVYGDVQDFGDDFETNQDVETPDEVQEQEDKNQD